MRKTHGEKNVDSEKTGANTSAQRDHRHSGFMNMMRLLVTEKKYRDIWRLIGEDGNCDWGKWELGIGNFKGI